MKINKKIKNIIYPLFCAILLIATFFLSYGTNYTNQAADLQNPIENTITVAPIAREGYSLTDGNEFFWRALEGFEISFDSSKIEEDSTVPPLADGSYVISYNVSYYAGYPGSNPENNDFITYDDVFVSEPISSIEELPSFVFYVDDFLTQTIEVKTGTSKTEEKEVSTKGWGVYKFSLNVNGQGESVSEVYYVEPDYIPEGTKLEIAYEVASSTTSMHNAYLFSVVEANTTFKYINKDCFVWYVYGKDFSDQAYCLTKSDAQNKQEFIEYGKWLYEDNAITRTGTTFYFDDNGHSGNWNVYCEYYDEHNPIDLKITSSEKSVMTGEIINKSTIFWAILGSCLGAVLILSIVIVISIKKERVW